jgi:hypothetical protein
MASTLLPYVVLVVAPLTWVAVRVARHVSPWLRVVLATLLLVLIVRGLPLEGVGYPVLKRLNLLLSAAMVMALLLLHAGAPWWTRAREYLRFLIALGVASVVVYLNFFAFHGGRTFMHRHDVAHYYLGSKYFHEVGYGDLYIAMIRAENDAYGGAVKAREVRDLATNQMLSSDAVLAASDTIKRRFSTDRWTAFVEDVRYFRDAMGPRYPEIFRDHGYNPTPVWTLMGGTIANRVPAGSAEGIGLLTLLDPVIEIAVFAAIGSAFGIETMLTSLVYFCVLYGAMFDWIGGAYLRYVSFAAIVGAACCVERRRHAAAGALLAVATMLRIFPVLFLGGPVLRGLGEWMRSRRLPHETLQLVGGFAATVALLFLASGLTYDGFAPWMEFHRNTRAHMASVSANILGATNWPTYLSGIDVRAPGGLEEFLAWRKSVFAVQLLVLFPVTVLILALVVQRRDDLEAMALSSVLVLTSVNIPAYYYTFMVLLVVAFRDRPDRVAWLFALEAVLYAFDLFEDHEVMIYLYKSALLFAFFAAVFASEARDGLGVDAEVAAARVRSS